MKMTRDYFSKTVAGALLLAAAILGPVPASAQSNYNKTSQIWASQGRISSINVTGTTGATALPGVGLIAWICNTGSNDAYLAFGPSSVTVTVANGSWLKAGTCWAYDLLPFGTLFPYVATITASSTTTLYVETGIGTPPLQTSSGGGGGGSVTQGTSPWVGSITDGTNGPVAVKPASTAPLATDKALVVAISPNSPLAPAVSNAGSGVATTSTNMPTVGYNYVFNGTTWDQLSSLTLGSKHAPTIAIVDASGNQITSFGTAWSNSNLIGNTTFGSTVTAWGGGTLGAMANYGTSPGAVLVPGVNASITASVLPTGAALDASVGTTNTDLGPPGATACATDTGSCSVNALLQRIAQRLTNATIALGQTTKSASAPVALASDQGSILIAPQALATGGATYAHIAAGQATTVVKASAGTLYSVCLNSAATATNTTNIYDNASGSGTVIAVPAATTATVPTCLNYGPAGINFALGLTFITATANGADMTVAFK
jgi:hypothetical protein